MDKFELYREGVYRIMDFQNTAVTYGRHNLRKGHSWRWGGIERHFEYTAKDWRDSGDTEHYENCNVCGRHYEDDEYLYIGGFMIIPDLYTFKCLCKDCAYEISDKVTEADGTEYFPHGENKNEKE